MKYRYNLGHDSTKTCRFKIHEWVDVDADDQWYFTVCRVCGMEYEFENLNIVDKIKFIYIDWDDRRRVKKMWLTEDPPF